MVVHGPVPFDARVQREARAACARGWEVDVVALRRPGQRSRERLDGATVIRVPLAHRHGGGLGWTAFEYVAFTAAATALVVALSARRRYAVVQIHNPPDFLALAGVGPRLLGARTVLDVHDLAPDMFAMRFGGRRGARLADRLLRALERLAAAASDRVVTVHEPYRRELESRGVAGAKLEVVMNSVDEAVLPEGGRRPTDRFTVVYHGTLAPHYGVDVVLEAAALAAGRIPELELEVYGEGDALPGLRRRAAGLGLGSRVRLPEAYLSHQEVLQRVRRASVGVVPNLPIPLNRYALSSKLFECVALGVPVVSADLPTIREHFSPSEMLFFRAGDAGSLSEALVQTARDPALAELRALAARRRYEAYRWPEQANRYTTLLEALA